MRALRLGHDPGAGHRHHGHRYVDKEDPPPSRPIDQAAAGERADSRGHRSEPRPRPDGRRSVRLAETGLQDGEAARGEQCRADPLQHPGGDEEADVMGFAAQDRRRREPHRPDHEHLAAAEAVPERATEQDERAQRQQVGGEGPLEGTDPGVEVPADAGQGHVDHRGVEAGHGAGRHRGYQRDAPSARAQDEAVGHAEVVVRCLSRRHPTESRRAGPYLCPVLSLTPVLVPGQ